MNKNRLSRRNLLASIGSGVGALTFGTGLAGANPSGRHLVGTNTRAATDKAQRRADSVSHVYDFGDIGQAVAGHFSEQALEALQNNPNVRYVESDGAVHAIAQTLPWGIESVDADVLHTNSETGDGADIAIIDTGIDDDHPDLQANVGAGKAYVNCDGSNCNYAWSDDNDHGTHCAGIADATDNAEGVVGVSTQATLHAVKVLDESGSGTFSDVAAGIEYTADQGWDVSSLSIGASSGRQTLKDACQYAYDNDVLLVAAAGNDGLCTDCVGYPAAYSTVMAISSTDEDDTLSSFSSTGPEIELAAPGGSIYSTVIDGYDTFSGTSMACPHVSGAGGQLMANGYTNTEAREQLSSTAEDLGLSSNEQGNGLLDAEAAVLGGDSSPSVSWVNPTDGEKASGTVTVQIDASDSEDSDDSLDVTYSIDSGSERSTSYNSDTGYYEDSWDTTGADDGDHTLAADVTDSADNTVTANITVTTDNRESPPAVDSLSLTEVETGDSDAEFDADWSVSDPDGNLSTVDLVLTQNSDGSTEDSTSISVSGDTASGTARLVAAGDDGSRNNYTVACTVTNGAGNTATDTASATETENTEDAPTIDSYTATEAGSPNPHAEITADWDVGDADGNLGTVTVEVTNAGTGSVVNSVSHDVSGSDATGTDQYKIKHANGGTYDVTLTAIDTAGNSTSATQTVTE